MAKNGVTFDVVSNRFHAAYRALVEAAADNVSETANSIEEEIQSKIWSDNIPVKTVKKNELLVWVTVGSRSGFYAGFLEFGTVDQPPQPIVIPAAKRHEDDFMRKARALERKARRF